MVDVIFISLVCLGIKESADTGILSVLYKTPKPIRKPVIDCPTCMAGLWGTLIYWIDLILSNKITGVENIFYWIITILAVAFLNTLLYNLSGFLYDNKIEK